LPSPCRPVLSSCCPSPSSCRLSPCFPLPAAVVDCCVFVSGLAPRAILQMPLIVLHHLHRLRILGGGEARHEQRGVCVRREVANLPTRREQTKPRPAPPRCRLRRGQTAIEIRWRIFPRGANDTNPAPAPFECPPSPPEQHRALERIRGVRLWQQGDGGGDLPSWSALDLHMQAICGRVGRIRQGGGARGGEAGYRDVLLVEAGGPGIASPLILSLSRRTCCCSD
jgi:hypothetical protein